MSILYLETNEYAQYKTKEQVKYHAQVLSVFPQSEGGRDTIAWKF